MPSQAHLFLQKFLSNPNSYALQQPSGGYRAVRGAQITDRLLRQHLSGEVTLGVYSTNPEDSTCSWICWDIDNEQEEALSVLITYLHNHNLHPIRESVRTGRSGHLWLFLDAPLSSAVCCTFGSYLRFYSHLVCEFFPKNATLKPGQLGNLVRLPLGRHQKPGAGNTIGLFKQCPLPDIETQLIWFNRQPLNSAQLMSEICSKFPTVDTKKPPNRQNDRVYPIMQEFPVDWVWTRTSGDEVIGRCPACMLSGFDNQNNNLSVNTKDNVLYCFRNQGEHKFIDIMKALNRLKIVI